MQLPSHVEWLVDRIGIRLEREVERQCGSACEICSILEVLCQADPTPGKLAVQWMAERLIDGGFLWEDVRSGVGSKAYETLVAFGTHRRTLAGPERNLATHATLASVWKAVGHLLPLENGSESAEPGIRERRRRERAAAHAESIVLCERPGLTVAVPLTVAASKWWGRGTRWCTAADKDNAFADYHIKGPLMVIVMGDTKLQLHLDTTESDVFREMPFMDETDESVSVELVERHWNVLAPIILWAREQNPLMLPYVPEGVRDRDMYMEGVAIRPFMLTMVPENLQDHEMHRKALRGPGPTLPYVPRNAMNVDLCLEAVMNSGFEIEFVPEEMQTVEVCMAAVEQSGGALALIPKSLRSRAVCIAAVTQDGDALAFVPDELKSEEICLMAVSTVGSALFHVPEPLRSRILCLAAVKCDRWTDNVFSKGPGPDGCLPKALGLVPKGFRDMEMCMAAVTQAGETVRFVPAALRTRDMYLAAVTRTGTALRHVPRQMIDRDMCKAALEQDGSVIREVPREMMDRDLCMIAVRQSARALRYVPDDIIDKEMCLAAIENDEDSIWAVPEQFLDRDICLDIARRNPHTGPFFPYVVCHFMQEIIKQEKENAIPDWLSGQVLDSLAMALAHDHANHAEDSRPMMVI